MNSDTKNTVSQGLNAIITILEEENTLIAQGCELLMDVIEAEQAKQTRLEQRAQELIRNREQVL